MSGMAMGVDAAAHRGALPGPTAAVLGSGVDVVSPPRNAALHREIREHGVVVSEYAPGVRAEPHHFPVRNRIIAALAGDVVIVEASRRIALERKGRQDEGNGALMRTAPVALRWWNDRERLVVEALRLSVPTHWAPRCGAASRSSWRRTSPARRLRWCSRPASTTSSDRSRS